MANCVRIISWNVNGLQNPVKRKKCLSYLKSQQTHIAFLQETHLTDSEDAKLKRDWVGQIYHSSYTSKKHGVAILVHKKLNFLIVKEQTDEQGRIILVEAKIDGKKVNLCNIYAPNIGDPVFFHGKNNLIGHLPDGHTILAGDFNQVLDGTLDKTTFFNNVPKDRMAIKLLMKDLGLIDVWRLVHPRQREYTFYSHNHKSHSRIDYFLIGKDLVESISDCTIGPIALTDHAAVQLDLVIKSDGARKNRWRLNVSLLQDPEFNSLLENELDNFFRENTGSVDRFGTVWEASKAHIRGKVIAFSSKKKREQIRRLKDLESQLKELEKSLSEKHSDPLLKKVCDLKFQINEIYNKKAEYALFRLKSNFYESGEKSGKLLARQLHQMETSYAIPAVKNEKGELVTQTGDINKVFAHFYEQLYKSEINPDVSNYQTFFSNIKLPVISGDQKNSLDSPITVEEVKKAISSMRVGKSPGLDGFPSEYYKKFVDKLAPILKTVYDESFSLGKLPETFNEALISLIVKKDKDPTDPGSFRSV